MSKHVPLRRCVVCRSSRPQGELLRFYKVAGAWQLDSSRKGGGRGAWLCRDQETCQRPKALKRFFRGEADSVTAQVSDYLSRHQFSPYQFSQHQKAHAVTQTSAQPAPQSTSQTTTQKPAPTPNRGGMNVR